MIDILVGAIKKCIDVIIQRGLNAPERKQVAGKQLFELYLIVDRVATCIARLCAFFEAIQVYGLIVQDGEEKSLKKSTGWNPYGPSIYQGATSTIREIAELSEEFKYLMGASTSAGSYFGRVKKDRRRGVRDVEVAECGGLVPAAHF